MIQPKVQPGDPLALRAETFNTFLDSARDWQARQHQLRRSAQREARSSSTVLVRYQNTAPRARFDVLGIVGPVFTRKSNPQSFADCIVLQAVVPAAEHVGRFVILQEPVGRLQYARAWIAGTCLVRVKMRSETDICADVLPGDATMLQSGSQGAAALLWIEPPAQRDQADVAWCVVRLGGASAAAQGWAKVLVANPADTTFKAKLVAADGTLVGDELTVNLLASAQAGHSTQVTLDKLVPQVTVNAIVLITQLPAAGSSRPPGWWLVGVSAHETEDCP